jgi:hypothetical protein
LTGAGAGSSHRTRRRRRWYLARSRKAPPICTIATCTQRENVRQAVARGYLRGPRPGRADARGPAGASHAIQDAIRAAVTAGEKDPAALAQVLADMFAAGFPTVDVVPLFPEPAHVPAVYVSDFPVDLFAVPPLPVVLWSAASETVPLFQL